MLALLPLDLQRELEHYTTGAWFRVKALTPATVHLEDLLFVQPGKPETKVSELRVCRFSLLDVLVSGCFGMLNNSPYTMIMYGPGPNAISIQSGKTIVLYESQVHEIFRRKVRDILAG